MKYMGSKNRIAKHILPIITKDRKPEQFFIEPFCGGCNSIDKVQGNRIAADSNEYIIETWKALASGWIPKDFYTKDEYLHIKANKDENKALTGWVGICCSYSGKWFGGFAGFYPESRKRKDGTLPDYQSESKRSVLSQVKKLEGVKFKHCSFTKLSIPDNSIIYCDPPYQGTTKYKDSFNHEAFFNWCRKMKSKGHTVFISEYECPEDFICVWQKEINSQLSANGTIGGNKTSTEKLFRV